MNSCIYEGQVKHRRLVPRLHEFYYKLFLVYVDLDELDTVFKRRWFWSTNRLSIAWLKRSDYIGDEKSTIKQAVINEVEKSTGIKPEGPIRMLTHLRYFGYVFNPVTFYYCFDKNDNHVETILAEITNTPWGQRHVYVLAENESATQGQPIKFSLSKEFHISPFMPMEMEYDWRFTTPGDALGVYMSNYSENEKVFEATLNLHKKPINATQCSRVLIKYPFMTLKVISGIYWQAFRLFLKKTPFYTHPEKLDTRPDGGVTSTD